jgi:response regulator RpfG family c-di-GMP phosphodiesterase
VEIEALDKAHILIVDDEPANVLLLERILGQAGYSNLTTTTDSSEFLGLCTGTNPDLVLLDLHMPAPDGFEVMRQLAPWSDSRLLPIMVLTADASRDAKQRALSEGAHDFLTKPLDAVEVLLRTRNLLRMRFLEIAWRKQNLSLEAGVLERTEDLHQARLEVLERLAVAGEYRDDSTGEHTRRVGRTSALIAEALGVGDEEVDLIRHAATLHDIGKIGIPDRILLKPGKLTPEEREVMKRHVPIGRAILSGSRSPLLRMSEQIAFTHHEWWDGTGYLSGMAGTEIPLAGRAVAIADVFDALTHQRPYKDPMPVDAAVAEIRKSSGKQFDPQVVEAFEGLDHAALLAPIKKDSLADRLPSAAPMPLAAGF